MKALQRLFADRYPVIAAVHYLPSPGYSDYSSIEHIRAKALADVGLLVQGGVDAIIVENNYDLPHRVMVEAETIAVMAAITRDVVTTTDLPVGVSVLWNDYRSALSIALAAGAQFIRIPAFVDDAQTDYGLVQAVAPQAIAFRHQIKADHIAILADVHVKHAEMADTSKSLAVSVAQAVAAQADGIIVTGDWTGDPPSILDLQEAKRVGRNVPIIIGSGADNENISQLRLYSNGVIVSTSLKDGAAMDRKEAVNLKSSATVFDLRKVQAFMQAIRRDA